MPPTRKIKFKYQSLPLRFEKCLGGKNWQLWGKSVPGAAKGPLFSCQLWGWRTSQLAMRGHPQRGDKPLFFKNHVSCWNRRKQTHLASRTTPPPWNAGRKLSKSQQTLSLSSLYSGFFVVDGRKKINLGKSWPVDFSWQEKFFFQVHHLQRNCIMSARPSGFHTKQFLEFVIVMTMVILKAKNVEVIPLVWQFGLGQASVLHVELPPRVSFLKECYQILMVCSELNYHISQNHIYLNRNIFCLNCHGLLVLLVGVISSLCIEKHKVESAKEIKRSAK